MNAKLYADAEGKVSLDCTKVKTGDVVYVSINGSKPVPLQINHAVRNEDAKK